MFLFSLLKVHRLNGFDVFGENDVDVAVIFDTCKYIK